MSLIVEKNPNRGFLYIVACGPRPPKTELSIDGIGIIYCGAIGIVMELTPAGF